MASRDRSYVAAWVDRDFAERFSALARSNERSASAEVRVALRRHLEDSAGDQPVNRLAAAGAARGGAA